MDKPISFSETIGYPSNCIYEAVNKETNRWGKNLRRITGNSIPKPIELIAIFAATTFRFIATTLVVAVSFLPLQLAYSIYWLAVSGKENYQVSLAKYYEDKGNLRNALKLYDNLGKKYPENKYYKNILSKYGLKQGEWQEICSEKPWIKDSFTGSDVMLTELEFRALKLLERYERTQTLSSDDKIVLKQFFSHISGNLNFNERISIMTRTAKKSKEWENIPLYASNALSHLREYSYKSKDILRLTELVGKFEKIGSYVEKGEEASLTPDDKIDMNDMRMVDSFLNMIYMVDWVNKMGLCDGDSFLEKIYRAEHIIDENMDKIKKRYHEELDLQTGDLVLDSLRKYRSYKGRSFDPGDKIDWMLGLQENLFGHKFQHAAIGIKTEWMNKIAEVDETFQYPSVNFDRLCISEVYRINFEKMLSTRGQMLFKKKFVKQFGSGLTNEKLAKEVDLYVRNKFQVILVNFLKDEERFENITNSRMRQVATVLKPHTKKELNQDFGNIDFSSKQEMFCSEYVGKVYAHCIHQLQQELNEEFSDQLVEQGIKKESAQKFVQKAAIIRNPIGKNENFEALHIDRLHELFCPYLTQLEMPKFVNFVFNPESI